MYKKNNHVADPLMDGVSENEDVADLPSLQRLKGSYRTTTSLGAILAIAVFLINTGVLVWAKLRFVTDSNGTVTVYQGTWPIYCLRIGFPGNNNPLQVRVKRPKT
jgi:hypothetical protein